MENFNDKKVREKLLSPLSDNDGWTRLIAYQSLSWATRVDHKIDWFFRKPGELKADIEQYGQKIAEKAPK